MHSSGGHSFAHLIEVCALPHSLVFCLCLRGGIRVCDPTKMTKTIQSRGSRHGKTKSQEYRRDAAILIFLEMYSHRWPHAYLPDNLVLFVYFLSVCLLSFFCDLPGVYRSDHPFQWCSGLYAHLFVDPANGSSEHAESHVHHLRLHCRAAQCLQGKRPFNFWWDWRGKFDIDSSRVGGKVDAHFAARSCFWRERELRPSGRTIGDRQFCRVRCEVSSRNSWCFLLRGGDHRWRVYGGQWRPRAKHVPRRTCGWTGPQLAGSHAQGTGPFAYRRTLEDKDRWVIISTLLVAHAPCVTSKVARTFAKNIWNSH